MSICLLVLHFCLSPLFLSIMINDIVYFAMFVIDSSRCKPMDAEDCEEFTDVYWIKFHLITNARFFLFFFAFDDHQ